MMEESRKSGEEVPATPPNLPPDDEIPTTPPSGELPMAPSPRPPEDSPSGDKPASPLIEEKIPVTAREGDDVGAAGPDLTEAIPEAGPESY